MFVRRIIGVICILITGLVGLQTTAAQDKKPNLEDTKKMQRMGALMMEVQRMTSNSKLAKELELKPEQIQKIQIGVQKMQDEMMKAQQSNPRQFDQKQFMKHSEKLMSEIKEVLSEKQMSGLTKKLDARVEKQKTIVPDQEQMKEMQRLSQMMRELQRLSYDQELASELEITSEQRAKIRMASQKFSLAMQERQRASDGGSFDMESYTQLMGDLMIEAQDILTPEQSRKLTLTAKLNTLKQQHGDEFGMIVGLANDYELNDNAKKKLKEQVEKARDDYYEKIAELKEDTLARIVSEIPPEHRDEVREAVRRYFEVDPRKRRGFGGLSVGN